MIFFGLWQISLTHHIWVVQWTAVWLPIIHYSNSALYTSGRVQSTLLTQATQWTSLTSSPVTNTFVGVLCTAITDEGSRRLPKRLEIVYLLASVNGPQSCLWYVCECLHGCVHVCVCVQVWVLHCLWCVWQCPSVEFMTVYMFAFATMWS